MGIELLLGKTLAYINIDREKNRIIFVDKKGSTYRMFHDQECSEEVYIGDIVGDIDDLIGETITLAEEVTNSKDLMGKNLEDDVSSFTWTFYKLATRKGYVTIRWFGGSNGCYSEEVEIRPMFPVRSFKS